MTELIIKKSEVEAALCFMEIKMFGWACSDNPNTNVPIRMAWLFAAAYVKNYYPEESVILINSYKLLQEKGYYYNVE